MSEIRAHGPFVAVDPDDLITRFVRPGDHVHLAATLARPGALLRSLARVFRDTRSLTVSMSAIHSSAHALALANCCHKVITGFLGDTFPTPRPNSIYEHVATGEPFDVELWPLLALTQRLMAGAMGQPFATTASDLFGTDLATGKTDSLHQVHVDGQDVTLMVPLYPDLALYHGAVADTLGNIHLCSPHGEGAWAGYAARRGVIATVEEIVDPRDIVLGAGQITIPASLVLGICRAQWGAHPNSLRTPQGGYLDDYDHLASIAEACATREGAQDWFDEWILDGTYSHYVEKLRLSGAVERIRLDAPVPTQPSAGDTGVQATAQERSIIVAARHIVRLVAEGGYTTLLAGIGSSHLAAWLACEWLASDQPIVFAAELGIVARTPARGDAFLFSQRHASKSEMLAGIPEVLGGLVAANQRCLAVLSTAEIDLVGNLNTTLLPDGRWITGTGGANDIASTTDCLVVTRATPRRLVERVKFVTSPGRNVVAVATDVGVLSRTQSEHFVLQTWLAEDSGSLQDALAPLAGWDPQVAPDLLDEAPISSHELSQLRDLDPKGYYRS